MTKTIFCPQCGQPLSPQVTSCPYCGYQITATEVDQTDPTIPVDFEPSQPEEVAGQTRMSRRHHKSQPTKQTTAANNETSSYRFNQENGHYFFNYIKNNLAFVHIVYLMIFLCALLSTWLGIVALIIGLIIIYVVAVNNEGQNTALNQEIMSRIPLPTWPKVRRQSRERVSGPAVKSVYQPAKPRRAKGNFFLKGLLTILAAINLYGVLAGQFIGDFSLRGLILLPANYIDQALLTGLVASTSLSAGLGVLASLLRLSASLVVVWPLLSLVCTWLGLRKTNFLVNFLNLLGIVIFVGLLSVVLNQLGQYVPANLYQTFAGISLANASRGLVAYLIGVVGLFIFSFINIFTRGRAKY
ncbi:hypothetical protein AWM75_02605 [Aerococcus urinaehominis]|uniref:Putative zinc-ribbon domain-containing protein n=1 Tax=Aerococcus urinaehominis TaxID=128944 RepID=A0A0X8FKE7_9LACT|nr:zinc ribbon domain-containing protein [Aerococcus urinaehominis]AMB98953.1 hypothetical protein AWM75_02605 [Aerococcus urinaehominis]SDM41078.1 zinc-ribbon domain-containing protein [Aerococcus urinaehominis]